MDYIIFLNPSILTLNGSAQAPKVAPFDFSSLLDEFPALIMLMIPLTYSITNGMGAGFITNSFLYTVSGGP
jgi:adenine/guanine/hypoxanthine permease